MKHRFMYDFLKGRTSKHKRHSSRTHSRGSGHDSIPADTQAETKRAELGAIALMIHHRDTNIDPVSANRCLRPLNFVDDSNNCLQKLFLRMGDNPCNYKSNLLFINN